MDQELGLRQVGQAGRGCREGSWMVVRQAQERSEGVNEFKMIPKRRSSSFHLLDQTVVKGLSRRQWRF